YDLVGINEALEKDRQSLRDMIQQTTPGNWLSNGNGEGTISNFPGCLIVSCNLKCHQEVGEILRQLREFSAQQGYPDPPIPDMPLPVHWGKAGFVMPEQSK
ncbi:MAG: hypothetical protein KDA66_18265, partial [Planctomycetaceae bacterium]|nr:hypothetical protein [Planctomycetaceae bacterium]